MNKLIFCLFTFLLTACGQEQQAGDARALQIMLQLPAAISRSSGRYETFLRRVEFMELEIQNGALQKEYRFPPAKWEALQVSDVPLPKSSDEKMEISIKIWDRREDGYRRNFPILTGQKVVSYQELKVGETPVLRIVMHASSPF